LLAADVAEQAGRAGARLRTRTLELRDQPRLELVGRDAAERGAREGGPRRALAGGEPLEQAAAHLGGRRAVRREVVEQGVVGELIEERGDGRILGRERARAVGGVER